MSSPTTSTTKPHPHTSVPIIDVSCFADDYQPHPGGPSVADEQAQIGRDLYIACSQVGFFAVRGHGCPDGVLTDAFTALQDFFDSPEKLTLCATQSPLFRGYNSVQTGGHSCTARELKKQQEQGLVWHPDLKESFTIGAENNGADGHDSPMHGPNQWPKSKADDDKDVAASSSKRQLVHFEPAMRAYWDVLLHTVAARIMKALARSLDLPASFFLKECSHPGAQMVLLRYPGTDEAGLKTRKGCGTHTDCGFLTILAQDDVEGLEVQRTDGTWMSVPPLEGAFVVNLGNMAARWTNDVYQSTPHRVRSTLRTRHSIPFFLNCNFETRVECLPGCGEPKYPPTEAGKYILEKLGLMAMMGKKRKASDLSGDGKEGEEKKS